MPFRVVRHLAGSTASFIAIAGVDRGDQTGQSAHDGAAREAAEVESKAR